MAVTGGQDMVSTLKKRLASMKSARSEHHPDWTELCRFVLPQKADLKRYTGKPDDTEIWNSTPQQCVRLLASRLGGLLTNPAERWAGLALRDDTETMQVAREYLDACTDRLMAVFNSDTDGFQQAADEMYLDAASMDIAIMYVARDGKDIPGVPRSMRYSTDDPGWQKRRALVNGERRTKFPAPEGYSNFVFRTIPVWQMYIGEDKNGRPAHFFRVFDMTNQQAWEAWGEKCSKKVRGAYESDPEGKVEVCHAVFPREAIKREAKKARRGIGADMPFASFYFETEESNLLEEGGYYECPYIVWRTGVRSGKVYGYGQAHIALPFVRLLHAMTETAKLAAEKLSDPPLMVPDDGLLGPVRSGSGGLSYYRAGTQDRIEALPITADLSHLGQEVRELEQKIEKIFLGPYVMFSEVPNETATAAVARINEKKSLLGGVLGRAQAEFLAPLIMRVFNIMDRAGDLPPVPEELMQKMRTEGPQKKRLRIEFHNEMAREQRSVGVYAFQRAIGVLAPIVGQNDPYGVLDNFDTDAAARDVPLQLGVAAKYLRTPEATEEIRNKRNAAAQAKQNAQDIAEGAQVAKTLADTDLGGNNALTVMAQNSVPGGLV